jgi:5'-deoxynucleotidase YfbR-like HD superfamily hydrolase
VPCGWECGYLANSEADLDEHENTCEHQTDPPPQAPAAWCGLTDAVIDLGRLALAFGRINRTAVYHPDQITPESDTDHTVMLGWVACALAARCFPGLDVGLVAQFALVHDAPEVYAGDTPTLRITPAGRAAKAEREHQATLRLTAEFAQLLPWFPAVLASYEAQCLPEARFVRGVDKILPKIVHLLDGCVGLTDQKISPAELAALCTAQRADMAGYVGEFAALLGLHASLADRVIHRPELNGHGVTDAHPDTAPAPRPVGSLRRGGGR